jgi:RNA polymerase primary sigma factor
MNLSYPDRDVRWNLLRLVPPLDSTIQANLSEATTQVLACLTPREERILRMRFGIGMDSDHTLGNR